MGEEKRGERPQASVVAREWLCESIRPSSRRDALLALTSPARVMSTSANAPAEPSHPAPGPTRNRLLAALPAPQFEELQSQTEKIELATEKDIALPGTPWTHVYFPENCIFSVVNEMRDGATVEVGTIGNEGVAGLPALMDATSSESRIFSQLAGSAWRVPVSAVVSMMERERDVRRLINWYAQAYLSQVSQGAACNRLHGIEQRCARWLLLTRDRVDSDRFSLKQEFLSDMLGVRRAGVSVAASALQHAGLIRYSRGVIEVLDREGQLAASCECYAVIREQFDRLVPS